MINCEGSTVVAIAGVNFIPAAVIFLVSLATASSGVQIDVFFLVVVQIVGRSPRYIGLDRRLLYNWCTCRHRENNYKSRSNYLCPAVVIRQIVDNFNFNGMTHFWKFLVLSFALRWTAVLTSGLFSLISLSRPNGFLALQSSAVVSGRCH